RKEEIRPISKIRDHVRRATRYYEGSQPGVRSSERNAQHSDIQGKDLGRVCPGDALPCRADNKGIHVDTNHGQVPPPISTDFSSGGGGGRISAHDVAADIPHRYTAQRGAPDEPLSSPDFLDDNEGEGYHAERFRDAVETCGE